jgi:hypothetical protein
VAEAAAVAEAAFPTPTEQVADHLVRRRRAPAVEAGASNAPASAAAPTAPVARPTSKGLAARWTLAVAASIDSGVSAAALVVVAAVPRV